MKKVIKYLALSILALVVLAGVGLTVLYKSADMKVPDVRIDSRMLSVADSGYKVCNGSYLRQSSSGLWEIYLKGNAVERGAAFGSLTKPLLYFQEQSFVKQIREIIPSESYLKFLRFFTVIFNRNLGKFVSEEYRQEIFAMSRSCSDEFDAIGMPYERQLNFHAAHDIGHTMQEYMLVGCSSFGVWDSKSSDGSLLIGRNFDFYVGDDFAKNKLVMFVNPSTGYKFASIGWAGMIGVLSGMNETGLTVTINAAKGGVPTSAATPISILVREILQYASTIKEAYAIAEKHKTFVSESILVGSAKDGRAAIIEKSPDTIGLFESSGNQIVCTNHYQSKAFANNEANIENIKRSDSEYRYKRIEQLLASNKTVDEKGAAAILRDRMGLGGKDIGLTNEKSLNQSIGHHSVIFKPEQLLMWVSTSPWQSGKFVCYDLKKIFGKPDFRSEIADSSRVIPADTAFMNHDYSRIVEFRRLVKYIRKGIKGKTAVEPDSLKRMEAINPEYFYTYDLTGDYYAMRKEYDSAKRYWVKALTKEIPRVNEREGIDKKIEKLK